MTDRWSEDAQRVLDDYAPMSEVYADDADRDPMKVAYDRPAMLAMAGDVRGLRVLDVGCATGALSAALVERGATVVGVDVDARFVARAQARLNGRATFHVADLAVRGTQGRRRALARRPQPDDAVANPGPRGHRTWPRHAKAGRVHEAADREQLLARPGGLRAVCGSGTTIIAAEMTGRACHAIEIDPAYVDVAVLRWQDVHRRAGGAPDGRSFAAVAAESAEPARRSGDSVMRGRKPMPTHLKVLRGNPGHQALRPEREPDYEAAPDIPEPPAFLMPVAKDEWRRIATGLVSHGPVDAGRREPVRQLIARLMRAGSPPKHHLRKWPSAICSPAA